MKLEIQDVKINLKQSLEACSVYLEDADINFIVDHGYEQMSGWYVNNYSNFCLDIQEEWGNYKYVMQQYEMLPDEDEEDEND